MALGAGKTYVMAGNGLGDFAAVALTPARGPRASTVVLVGDEGRTVREIAGTRAGGENGVVRLSHALRGELPQDLDWVRAAQDTPVELVLLDAALPTGAAHEALTALLRERGTPGVEVVSVGGPYPCTCGAAPRLLPPGGPGDAVAALLPLLDDVTVCLVGAGDGSAESAARYWEFVSGLTSARETSVEEAAARELATVVVQDCSDVLSLVCAGALGFEGEVATFPDGEIARVDRSSAGVLRFTTADEPLALAPHECAGATVSDRRRLDGSGRAPDAVTWRRLAQTMGITGPGAVARAGAELAASGERRAAFPVHRL
ncbi:hypothetical protein ACIRQQ_43010 [Streptomyces fuscichromogenes]|uniref:hypothetical protein n=1 Tax=Streptomyces fuscichromogenes TaxID=1324013 RepID=UPI0038205796